MTRYDKHREEMRNSDVPHIKKIKVLIYERNMSWIGFFFLKRNKTILLVLMFVDYLVSIILSRQSASYWTGQISRERRWATVRDWVRLIVIHCDCENIRIVWLQIRYLSIELYFLITIYPSFIHVHICLNCRHILMFSQSHCMLWKEMKNGPLLFCLPKGLWFIGISNDSALLAPFWKHPDILNTITRVVWLWIDKYQLLFWLFLIIRNRFFLTQ